MRLDLNSDLGEAFGSYKLGMDEEIIRHVSSINMSCGWHAGDPMVMEKTTALCKNAGVAIGAHPGYPDLMGFGRHQMKISFEEAKAYTKYQLGALMAFTASHGMKVQHMKPHGAFGNLANKDETMARAICEAVKEVDPEIIILGYANCIFNQVAESMGLRYANEVYADRAYNDDYTLVARGTPGAMIEDPQVAAQRVIRMVKEKKVTSISGKELDISVHSVCVHGDTPSAVKIVKDLRTLLESEGIEICNIQTVLA